MGEGGSQANAQCVVSLIDLTRALYSSQNFLYHLPYTMSAHISLSTSRRFHFQLYRRLVLVANTLSDVQGTNSILMTVSSLRENLPQGPTFPTQLQRIGEQSTPHSYKLLLSSCVNTQPTALIMTTLPA